MFKGKRGVDKVRASRDEREFHETWAARKASQLLMPTDGLVGIAIEGLSSPDNKSAAQASVEIADLTLYYGRDAHFTASNRVAMLQFKYSVGRQRIPFRMSDARKTVKKFAIAFRDHRSRFGIAKVDGKIEFALLTNRPI